MTMVHTACVTPAVSGGPQVNIANHLCSDLAVTPTLGLARYVLESDGEAKCLLDNGPDTTFSEEWWTESPVGGIGTLYEVRATLQAGTSPSGDSLGVWLALSTIRSWFISSSSGFITGTILVEIRDVSLQIVRDSATITINAEST